MTMNQERLLRDLQLEDRVEDEGSESEYDSDSDDSENDPSFSIRDGSSTKISHQSVKKKSRNRVNLESESEPDEEAGSVHKLDAKDEKSFELVQNVIEAGHIEKLKVDQCKVYLRKNGLRLTGNKDTLIQRIKEHQEILNGGGEKKYPQSSFVLNCKGDACMGDVVMFEQNVYEMFNIASRSASGPPCGTRIVVGRIVKESYGAAKQQHTFTVEVLWSKGEKPLPPLHPLLIKGRNLYRLKTLRQRWEDEGLRQKALMEKHSRGSLARSNRDARMEEKKMRKMLKATRISRKSEPKKQSRSNPIQSQHQPTSCLTGARMVENQFIGLAEHSQQQSDSMELAGASQPSTGLTSQSQQSRSSQQKINSRMVENQFIGLAEHSQQQLDSMKLAGVSQPSTGLTSRSQQPRASQQSSSVVNSSKSITQPQHSGFSMAAEHQWQNNQMRQMDSQRRYCSSIQEVHHRRSAECHPSYNLQQNQLRPQDHVSHNNYHPNGSSLKAYHVQPLRSNNHMNPSQRQMDIPRMYSSSIHEVHHQRSFECHPNHNLQQNHVINKYHPNGSSTKAPLGSNNHMNPPKRQGHVSRQPCRHYAQGRCHYGENCKYLHELKDEYPQRREEAWCYGGNNLGSRPY